MSRSFKQQFRTHGDWTRPASVAFVDVVADGGLGIGDVEVTRD
jgi:hypothetical protein